MLRISILLAAGGGFIFMLILAKYWNPIEYGDFVREYSLISYLSFPILYGLIPQMLRSTAINMSTNVFRLLGNYKGFLAIYGVGVCAILIVASSGFIAFLVHFGCLIIILASGLGEAQLRRRAQFQTVFFSRAIGIATSILMVVVILSAQLSRTALDGLIMRVLPSAALLAVVFMLTSQKGDRKPAQIGGKSSHGGQWVGVIESTTIALTIGIFQYALLIAGSRIVEPAKFVGLSVGLTVSITVSQKLIEPHVFRLFDRERSSLHIVLDELGTTGFWWFLELFMFSYCALIAVEFLLQEHMDFLQAFCLSVGAAMASIAYIVHTAIYVYSKALKFSIFQLTLFGAALVVLVLSNVEELFAVLFLIMAAAYLYFARRQLQATVITNVNGMK